MIAAPPLVDVAPLGCASQSSTSRWSRRDDAMGALGSHDRGFGFHTDLETGPWWVLQLDRVYAPQAVIVHNRHGRLRARAAALTVEASRDGADWRLLHCGPSHFGAEGDPEGPSPLVLHLGGRHETRFLRLSLPGRGQLHLARVEVLVEASAVPRPAPSGLGERLRAVMGAPPRKVFLAARRDGFGERLRAMINAMILAERFGGEFRFAWGESRKIDGVAHTLLPKEETFAPDFLAAHVVGKTGSRGYARISGRASLEAGTRFQVEQVPLAKLLPGVAAGLPADAAAAAFGRIRFSERLEQARRAAADPDLPAGAAAIHLRAGDVIYGRNRLFGRFAEKALAWPLAFQLAAELCAEGRTLLVFGQDAALCRRLAAAHGGVFAGDVAAARGFDVHQAVLFEIALMARCAEIHAGSSGFAFAACQIAGIAPSQLEDRLDRGTIRQLLLEALAAPAAAGDEVSDLQHAFAFWSAAHVYADLFDVSERLRFLAAARAHDRGNALYGLAHVGALLEAGETVGAAAALAALVEAEAGCPDGTLRFVLGMRRHRRGSPADFVIGFGDLARSGHAGALLCQALTAGEPGEARAAATRFLALRPAGLAAYDAEVSRVLAG